ncbi:hypothetical protein NBT05_10935 [Aquimarina sp. ERC-38]|uniref:choice-of-anchor I domain-containing protein n=1 Tax=Aquimarina sp. ERC-38 TaxID=2949996 RepID=UPI0022470304|nr:hypothetical protein [Aquimarina sp. ERC-38]UZO79474.1 hypothetical protein NBT05_10935 [Aquimarina sp. ERC-38]
MKRSIFSSILAIFYCVISSAQVQELLHLSSYQTDMEDAAETVAYSSFKKRAYFTSSSDNSLSILDISNPVTPVLVQKIDLSPYGAGPNSVAVFESLVAVAVEAEVKQDNGMVVFFDTDGTFLTSVVCGALPDMLTFTPDGTKVLVANEGEPNDAYTNDPEGSISIIDISQGVATASTTTINFEVFNNKKAALQNKGVRIFGNSNTATVAQDLEPEFITVTPDGSRAYVNCQENNALVVIDLSTNEILDILPLGYKNHLLGTPSVTSYVLNQEIEDWPVLGTPVYDNGQPEVLLGGFSGLYYDASESTDSEMVFYTVPDRGPNDSTISKSETTPPAPQNLRPFKLPDYQGRIVKFTINTSTGEVSLAPDILLFRKDGQTPITGKGNIPGFDEVPVTYTDS